jgi:membrane-associated protease RseP (regulator of RpoE activity)
MNSFAAVRRLPARTILRFAFAATLLFALLAPQPVRAQSPSPEQEETAVLGILGLSAPDGAGVTVARVVDDSGADGAGLETGDLITALDGTEISSMEDLTAAMEDFEVGDTITITYTRDGESRTGEAELGTSSAGRGNPFQIPDFDPRFPEEAPNQPGSPDREPRLRQDRGSDADYRPVLWLFGTLITAALVTLIVLLVRKNRPAPEAPVQTSAYVPPASANAGDPLEVLRMRYAKGEITRDEYLTMSADLNGSGTSPSGENPTQEL